MTERPVSPETDVTVRFTLPSQTDTLSVRARVAWVSAAETESGAISGMEVRFLELTPSQAIGIGTFVDSTSETSRPDSSYYRSNLLHRTPPASLWSSVSYR